MADPLPVSASNASHYRWGEGCDGWHLVKSAELSVIQEQMPPQTHEVRHLHTRSRQFFFVLRGALTVEVDAVAHIVPERHGIEISPGVFHEVRNESDGQVDFLVISQPPSHGDRIVMAGEPAG